MYYIIFFFQISLKQVLEMYCTELIIVYKYMFSYIFIKYNMVSINICLYYIQIFY